MYNSSEPIIQEKLHIEMKIAKMIGSALHTYAKQLLSASSNLSQTEKIFSLKLI